MTLDLFKEKGVPLARQAFTWRDMVRSPVSKLDDDAFTRCRIILMNGIEQEANRFSHSCARFSEALRLPLAQIRRVEHHQQTLVNWLLPADMSPLETTLNFEQLAIELTAMVAQQEPDDYLAQVHRFGMLEDFDHLYRFAALLDRMEGKDANNILQSYTDIVPGRPTRVHHRAPVDDVRRPYARQAALPLSKLNALTILSSENQTRDYYMTVGPQFADPMARQLYAEIASVEEQHVTQYESIIDPSESILEKWLLHEACEVYNYYSCYEKETNLPVKKIWERFVGYELGHLHMVAELFQKYDKRDAAEVLPQTLPPPFSYTSQREFVRKVLHSDVDLRAAGTTFIDAALEPQQAPESISYRAQLHHDGCPSDLVAEGYRWTPGTELLQTTFRRKRPSQEARQS